MELECFFIPHRDIERLMFKGADIEGIIQITTNFKSIMNARCSARGILAPLTFYLVE